MSNPKAIEVKNLSKVYTLYDSPSERLKQMALWRAGHEYGKKFWALKDVSFEIGQGEMFGVAGQNGSGKSTLLQILAGTLTPTTGSVIANGRIAALLELGSGFNPEFTGRENVFLNGSILGMTQSDIENRFDNICDFADIGDFLDQPVKVYSSGMLVRLAFAVQVCIDPDILIVDEALSVGDFFFKQKCYRRIEELVKNGTTVLLVSHGLDEIRRYCNRMIVLDRGRKVFEGNSAEGTVFYMFIRDNRPLTADETSNKKNLSLSSESTSTKSSYLPKESYLNLKNANIISQPFVQCLGVAITDNANTPTLSAIAGETIKLHHEYNVTQDIGAPLAGFGLRNLNNVFVHGKNNVIEYAQPDDQISDHYTIRFTHEITLDIAPGDYSIEVGISAIDKDIFSQYNTLSIYELYDKVKRCCYLENLGPFTVMQPTKNGKAWLNHHGVANLPGNCTVSLIRDQSQI